MGVKDLTGFLAAVSFKPNGMDCHNRVEPKPRGENPSGLCARDYNNARVPLQRGKTIDNQGKVEYETGRGIGNVYCWIVICGIGFYTPLTDIRHWRILTQVGLLRFGLPMVIIETPVFTEQLLKLLSDEEYQALQHLLIARPDVGKIIPQGGGLRKVRWGAKGKGKRGGSRVIYYWAVSEYQILLLLIYSKNEREDLMPAQLKAFRQVVEEEYK